MFTVVLLATIRSNPGHYSTAGVFLILGPAASL